MRLRQLLTVTALLALFLLDTPVLHAEAADGEPVTPAGYPRRFNTTGADFGSNVELGVSGSTPGILLGPHPGVTTFGAYRSQAAGTDNGNTGWGLLGLLGLLGLSGLRSRRSSDWNA